MLVTAVMVTIGTAGVAFYVRFLLELQQECKRGIGGCWVRLRLDSEEHVTDELAEKEQPARRAA